MNGPIRTEELGDIEVARHLAFAAASAALLLASPATAAPSQGSFGATSTGSISINASVPGRVRISKLSDVTFANADPSVDASNAQNVCVWSNTSTRGYSITATGSGSSSAFALSNGTDAVPYTVGWAQSSGETTGSSLTAGAALTGQTSTATNSDCSAGPAASASLVVTIASSTLQSMAAGVDYTGTLTLVVAPE